MLTSTNGNTLDLKFQYIDDILRWRAMTMADHVLYSVINAKVRAKSPWKTELIRSSLDLGTRICAYHVLGNAQAQ